MGIIENISNKALKPIGLLNKTNEVIDVVNTQLNVSYSEENPLLKPQGGICTWYVNHNLGTTNISCTIYQGDTIVTSEVKVTSKDTLTIIINSLENIPQGTYTVTVLAKGGVGASGGGGTSDSYAYSTTNPSLSPSDGIISWTITHSLNTENVVCSLYSGTNEIEKNVTINSANSITVTFPATSTIAADSHRVVVLCSGGQGTDPYFIAPNTIIDVPVEGSIQNALNSLEGKWCTGMVIIRLAAGTYTLTDSLHLEDLNRIKKIAIVGDSKSTTIIQLPTISTTNQSLLRVTNQSLVHLQNLTLKTQNTNGSIVLESQNSRVELADVSLQDGNLCAINNQGGSTIKLIGNCDITNTSTSTFGILSSNTSKFLSDAYINFAITNCSIGIYAEMGAINSIFYLDLDTTSVTTPFNPALNEHTGTGWNLGITS